MDANVNYLDDISLKDIPLKNNRQETKSSKFRKAIVSKKTFKILVTEHQDTERFLEHWFNSR